MCAQKREVQLSVQMAERNMKEADTDKWTGESKAKGAWAGEQSAASELTEYADPAQR